MSTSPRSKPASPSSPATGPEAKPASREPVAIELEISRQRQIAWTIGGTLGGLLLVRELGTVGVWAGYVLIALGLFRAYQLVRSFVFPVGSIVVSEDKVSLPRGRHGGRPLEVKPSAVTAVYFLRRSVPWNRASPVLIVELGDRAMAFPRDWFATEADQRHVVHALLRHLPPTKREPEPAPS